MNALAQLIEDVQESSSPRLTQAEIARRSGISPQRMSQYMNDEMRALPTADHLRGLAKALQVPLRVVIDAALASLGLPHAGQVSPSGEIDAMRHMVENSTIMTDEDRAYWNAMIDALDARTRSKRPGRRGA